MKTSLELKILSSHELKNAISSTSQCNRNENSSAIYNELFVEVSSEKNDSFLENEITPQSFDIHKCLKIFVKNYIIKLPGNFKSVTNLPTLTYHICNVNFWKTNFKLLKDIFKL